MLREEVNHLDPTGNKLLKLKLLSKWLYNLQQQEKKNDYSPQSIATINTSKGWKRARAHTQSSTDTPLQML